MSIDFSDLRNVIRGVESEYKERTMRQLLFKNNIHKSGLNFTVRDGDKWADAKIGECVEIRDTNDPEASVRIAKIRMVIQCSFRDIPGIVLEKEHDPNCESRSELLQAMICAYGDKYDPCNPEVCVSKNIVTCIGYELVNS